MEVELARAGHWPQINGSLSAQRNRVLNFPGQPVLIQTRLGTGISISDLLGDFGARSGTLDQAKLELAAARGRLWNNTSAWCRA